MIIQNIHNKRVKQEISRENWNKLGSRQKLFTVLDETDSPALKQQTISNSIGKPGKAEPGKDQVGKPDKKADEKKSESKKDSEEKK